MIETRNPAVQRAQMRFVGSATRSMPHLSGNRFTSLKRRIYAGVRIAAAGFALSGVLPAAARAEGMSLEAILAEAMKGDSPPGMGVLVIDDNRIAGQAVHGVRRLGHQEKVQLADRWHLGSNAKAFTATLIARLVEQKKLSWNTPLEKLLPEHAAGMRPEYRDVTLLDLLSHRSGLSDLSNEDPLFRSFYDDARPLSRQRSDWAAAMLSRAPATKKRSEPKYSNSGYILAGTIAEKATGIPYETLIRREILKPLGLKTATFKAPGSGEPFGHVHGRAAKPRDSNPQVIGPAGNLRMSLQDWARFSLDQMAGEKGGGKLLTRESYRLLHRSQGGTEEALGWGVAPAFAGRRGPVISHTGSDGNWFAAVALFPDAGDGVLVVANAGSKMGGERAVLNVAMPILGTLSQPSN